jgi:ABC-type Fe3+-hydroxamate transport system substrate-binding protein
MKIHLSILLAIVSVLALAGCSDETTAAKSKPASSEVHYYVLMASIGALKITYKDNNGQVVVDDPVPAKTVGVTWEKKFIFDGPVDALLKVELPESAPPDPVGAEFFIAVNDERVQKGTKFITKKNSMTLTYNSPPADASGQ